MIYVYELKSNYKSTLPGMSSLIEYRERLLLLILIGSIFLSHVIFGGGFPVALQFRMVLCPISTTLLVIGD